MVEVPAGPDAALYLLENGATQEGNSWAAWVRADEGGQWLTQLEVGLEVDGASPEEPVGVDLFLPDEVGTQEIASQVQSLLSGASVQGVRAQELDFSQAQVVILEAEQEEATALVVVPEAAAGGQGLLRGGFGFDLDQAVYTAVKVQRVSGGSGARGTWQVTPTPVAELPVIVPKPKPVPTPPKLPAPKPAPPSPPPPPVPPVQLGTAIKPAFTYCPYQYYGKIMTLQRALCQDSWQQWYGKQLVNGKVTQNMLKAYNVAKAASAGDGVYSVIGAWDKNRDFDLLLAGLSEVDENTLQEMWSVASKALNAPHEEPDPALAQFLQTLGDGSAKLDRWMLTLQEAISQGRFEEEYNRLLAEGLDKLEQALLKLSDFQDRNEVRQLIREIASRWPKVLSQQEFNDITDAQDAVVKLLREVYAAAQVIWDACQVASLISKGAAKACEIATGLQTLLDVVETWLGVIPCSSPYSCIDAFIGTWKSIAILMFSTFGGQEAVTLSQSIRDLISKTWESLSCPPTDRILQQDCFKQFDDRWKSLWGLMFWMTDANQTVAEQRYRAERGYSTILIAGNAMTQSPGPDGSRWFFLGLKKNTYPYGTWWGAILVYYPSVLAAPNAPPRKVAVVAGGDHCQERADQVSVHWDSGGV